MNLIDSGTVVAKPAEQKDVRDVRDVKDVRNDLDNASFINLVNPSHTGENFIVLRASTIRLK